LADLKAERDDTIRDVLEYNNKLTMQNRDFQLKRLKADRDYAIKKAKLSSSSSSRYRSSSGSSKPKSSGVLGEWNNLTGAGKLKFYNDNYDMIKNLDMDVYRNIAREISEYIKRGLKPSKNKSDNYYK